MYVCVCNPGLSENVITCMSKRALVYVSKMAPVLRKHGLPDDTKLQMSAARATCENVCVGTTCLPESYTHTTAPTKHNFPYKQTITCRTSFTGLCGAKAVVLKLI